jgi:hypothetical protein
MPKRKTTNMFSSPKLDRLIGHLYLNPYMGHTINGVEVDITHEDWAFKFTNKAGVSIIVDQQYLDRFPLVAELLAGGKFTWHDVAGVSIDYHGKRRLLHRVLLGVEAARTPLVLWREGVPRWDLRWGHFYIPEGDSPAATVTPHVPVRDLPAQLAQQIAAWNPAAQQALDEMLLEDQQASLLDLLKRKLFG